MRWKRRKRKDIAEVVLPDRESPPSPGRPTASLNFECRTARLPHVHRSNRLAAAPATLAAAPTSLAAAITASGPAVGND